MLGGQEKSLCNSPFLFFLSFAFFLFPIHSQIPLGSKLTVQEKNFWVSSKGNFAVGFFNRSNQHGLGIRFNSPPIPTHKHTVIWVAGADITVGEKSYFQLTQIGELILFDSTRGAVAWTSNTTNSSVALASISDEGNLILFNKNQAIVWQSFDIPSDTLLPGQNLSDSQTLRAASRNSISSYYSLYVLNHLQLKWESNVAYWTSGPPSQSNLRTLLRSDGTLQLLDERSKPVWSVYGEDHGDPDVKFRFLRLDVDGNLRLYSWVQALSSWRSVWQAVENQCNVFDTCGLNGVCIFNSSGSPVCKCPFSPTSESNSKCLVPYRQGCKSGSSVDTLEHTILYGVYPPNETIIKTSLQQCKSLCQRDPLCFASTFTNDGTAECRIKKTQYVSGHLDPSLSSVSFVKRCLDPFAVFPITNSTQSALPNRPNGSKKICIPCFIGVAGGVFVFFVLIHFGIGFWIYKTRRRRRKSLSLKSSSVFAGPNPNGFVVLSYTEIKDITENFKNQIGPKMFKGVLENKSAVAVKELNDATIEERKFRCSVLKIESISHKSLVKLEGYCCEPGQRFLVYEFVKNGSVAKCLKDPKICKRLTWRKRMDICLTVAKAVSYLHNDCREFVSHGNLKCKNVLLGEKMEAKVSEFGLVRGGSAEGDALDFGKMALQLVRGCEDVDFECMYEKWLEGGGHKIVDERIEGGLDLNELERLLRVALWCLQNDERMRPSMGEVVKVLEGTLAIDPPPPPFKIVGCGSGSGSDLE